MGSSSSKEASVHLNTTFSTLSDEQITVTSGLIAGFFFDSLTNKYQVITYGKTMDDYFSFYISSIELITTWKKVGSSFLIVLENNVPQSVVNGCLHWMVIGKEGEEDILPPCAHSIVVFSIEDCEFRLLPHPGKVNESCQGHQKMHLLATKGHLYAYGMHAKILDIWVLEDSANWYWVKKFSIHLERDLKQYSIDDISIMSYQTKSQMKFTDIWKDEVLLVVSEKGFFWYHMRLKIITEAQFAHLPIESHSYTRNLCEVIAIESNDEFQVIQRFLGFEV